MQINVSLVLNILLLIGVIIAIICLMKSKRQTMNMNSPQPSLGSSDVKNFDEIIAVRKITVDEFMKEDAPPPIAPKPTVKPIKPGQTLMVFLAADSDRQLTGYELLQVLLASGLRFGEGNLFHRHEHANGQGPVLFSLAAATPTGMFDLQNIGAFSVRGLCLYMHASGDSQTDAQRLTLFLQTAKQLSEELNTRLLDNQRQPFTQDTITRYHNLLNLTEAEVQ